MKVNRRDFTYLQNFFAVLLTFHLLVVIYGLLTYRYKNQTVSVAIFTVASVVSIFIFCYPPIMLQTLFQMDTIFGNILFQIDGLSTLFALPVIIVSFSAFLFSRFYFPEKKIRRMNITVIFFPVLIFSNFISSLL